MHTPADPRLRVIASTLSPEAWEERVAAADLQAGIMQRALEPIAGGEGRSDVLADLCPDLHVTTLRKRLARDERGGRDALIDRCVPTRPCAPRSCATRSGRSSASVSDRVSGPAGSKRWIRSGQDGLGSVTDRAGPPSRSVGFGGKTQWSPGTRRPARSQGAARGRGTVRSPQPPGEANRTSHGHNSLSGGLETES